MPDLAARVPASLSPGEHGMKTSTRGAKRGANCSEAYWLPTGIGAPSVTRVRVSDREDRQWGEGARYQHDARPQAGTSGRRLVPPPPRRPGRQKGSRGVSDPPPWCGRMVFSTVWEGRSRPDSEPSPCGNSWPSAWPVHDPLALPSPVSVASVQYPRGWHVHRHRFSGRTHPCR